MVGKKITVTNIIFNCFNLDSKITICHTAGIGREGNLYSAKSSILVFNTLYLETDPGPIFGVLVSYFFKVPRFCINCKPQFSHHLVMQWLTRNTAKIQCGIFESSILPALQHAQSKKIIIGEKWAWFWLCYETL